MTSTHAISRDLVARKRKSRRAGRTLNVHEVRSAPKHHSSTKVPPPSEMETQRRALRQAEGGTPVVVDRDQPRSIQLPDDFMESLKVLIGQTVRAEVAQAVNQQTNSVKSVGTHRLSLNGDDLAKARASALSREEDGDLEPIDTPTRPQGRKKTQEDTSKRASSQEQAPKERSSKKTKSSRKRSRDRSEKESRSTRTKSGNKDKKRRRSPDKDSDPSSSSSDDDHSSRKSKKPRMVESPQASAQSPTEPDDDIELPKQTLIVDERFKTILSFQAYRLKKKSQRYTPKMAQALAKRGKAVRASYEPAKPFDGEEPLEVFDFLRKFVKACNDNGVNEGRALHIFPYCLSGNAAKAFMAMLPDDSGFRPNRFRNYPDAIAWFLDEFAPERTVTKALADLMEAKQRPQESEKDFALRLGRLSSHCGDILEDGAMKSQFINGLLPYIREEVRNYNAPDKKLQHLVTEATSKGKTFRSTFGPILGWNRRARGVSTVGGDPEDLDAELEEADAPLDEGCFQYDPSVVGLAQPPHEKPNPKGSFREYRGNKSQNYMRGFLREPKWARNTTEVGNSPTGVRFDPKVRTFAPQRSLSFEEVVCLFCGDKGHYMRDCPIIPPEVRKEANALRAKNREQRPQERERNPRVLKNLNAVNLAHEGETDTEPEEVPVAQRKINIAAEAKN